MLNQSAEELKRDGGATKEENKSNETKPETKKDDAYRSQKQVDQAFKKRLSGMREKWESEQKEKQKTEDDEQKAHVLMQNIEKGADDFLKRILMSILAPKLARTPCLHSWFLTEKV